MAVLRLIALGFLMANAPQAIAEDSPSEDQIKAAFLLNFARFVEWPNNAFSAPSDPLVLCIFGKGPLAGSLEQAISGKAVNGHPLRFSRVSDVSSAKSCQVLFLPATEARRIPDVASSIANGSVLLVGEADGFTDRGGMINFVLRDNHVRFEINAVAASRANLKISSKLMQLAVPTGAAK